MSSGHSGSCFHSLSPSGLEGNAQFFNCRSIALDGKLQTSGQRLDQFIYDKYTS